jgi:hypothetical protein
MRILIFATTYVWNIFHSQKNSARYDHKYTIVHVKCSYSDCQVLMELELCQQIFEKYFNIKFHEYPFSGTQVVPCGREGGQSGRRTDGQT